VRFYIASGLENRELVKDMMDFFRNSGHEPAYDWTAHGDVRGQGLNRLMEVAISEYNAVRDAEFLLVMFPGGKGTHTEIGIGLGAHANKRIVLWSATGKEFEDGPDTCAFYHHQAIEKLVCSYDELKERLSAIL